MLNRARPFAAGLVEREERRTGSRMAAYERVSEMVGVSGSWLRKLLGRHDGLMMEAHEFLNIAAAYRRVCERIEAERDREREMFLALRGDADAALESTGGLVAMAPEAHRGRAAEGLDG